MSARRRKAFAAGAAAFAVALLAACSPGTADTADDAGSTGSAGAADGPLADVQADVEAAVAPRDSFELPTEPVDVSALEGQTVYYVPLTAAMGL